MPLTLIPPGQRKGNRYFLLRGTFRGRRVEVSTKTADISAARRFAEDYRDKLATSGVPEATDRVSFERAVELYKAFRKPSRMEEQRLNHLVAAIGHRMVADLRHADLVEVANRLYGHCTPETRNRQAMRPAAAVLHYAAANELCSYLRIPLFREKRPETRAVDLRTARGLVKAAPQGAKRLLLLWLFRHGMRIGDTLRVRCEDIDLKRRIYRSHVSKTDRWIEHPLHEDVFLELANSKLLKGEGWLFPWRSRWAVYRWLKPIRRSLGIAFTPHMARHSLGRWLNEAGASLRTIMDTLGHADIHSSARYQSTDIEVIRATSAKIGALRSSSPARSQAKSKHAPRRDARA